MKDQTTQNISGTRAPAFTTLTLLPVGKLFLSRKAVDEVREAGVAIAICTALVRKLESLPGGVNDHLMVMRIPLARQQENCGKME